METRDQNPGNDESFFPNAPLSEIRAALDRARIKTNELRIATRAALKEYDLIIGQSNRPDRMHTQLVEWGIIPCFDYFFTGSKIGAEHIAQHWIEREVIDCLDEQTPYIWDSPSMWKKFWDLLEANKDKKILLISSAPRKEHRELSRYPNILFASPTPDLAVLFEYDKRYMAELYSSIGIEYSACNYTSSDLVLHGYEYHAKQLKSPTIVVQAAQGSGGVTMKSSTQALFFVYDEESFRAAIARLEGEGPLRIMKKYEGIPSNSAGLALPFGTYISGIPTVKPCGVSEVGAKSGTSGGNQWDTRFHDISIDSQFTQIAKVGAKMSESGFHGVFGLDPIMPLAPDEEVFNSEINARSQGPDPQRALAAHRVGMCTLEELQLAHYLGCPSTLYPNVDDYNLVTRWLRIPPYLKLFAKKDHVVNRDFNGYWNWENGRGLQKADPNTAAFRISGAPQVGQKIVVSSPDNFLYVKFRDVAVKIYTDDTEPKLTPYAGEIVDYLYANI